MEINNTYEIKINENVYYVYEGTCDGTPTKWITKTKWDYKINVKMIVNELKYMDSNNDEILVFEEDDEEYSAY